MKGDYIMTKWNGKDKHGNYQYPLSDIDFWDMQIDENGTIYYTTHEKTPRQMIWSTASQLTAHLHKVLVQIPAR